MSNNMTPPVRFRRKQNYLLSDLRSHKTKKADKVSVFFVLVAGPGIEPGSGGYEPPEVPLLHPAMFHTVTKATSG